MSYSAAWSDDRVTTLRKLWIDGLSASQIARALGGVSRSAVIGKVHRLGLAGRAAPAAPGDAPRKRGVRGGSLRLAPARRTPGPAAAAVEMRGRPAPTSPVDEPGLAAGVMALSAHVCRWPIGDPKADGFSFCGRPAAGVYCRAHAAVGVQPGKATRLDRDPVVRRALAGLA